MSGWLVEPTTSVLDCDRAIDDVEQEVHHGPTGRSVRRAAELLGLEELELVEEHGERRHLVERAATSR